MELCCIFNYAPLYRESIYKKIDENFDAQFYFGKEVYDGKISGIAKLDYSIFRRNPIDFKNKYFFKYLGWRTKTAFLGLKKFEKFLITGDFVFSYLPLILTCKLLGKKVYAWGHGSKTLKGKLSWITKWFYNNLDGFFTYGEGGKQRLVDLGFDKNKLHVIYNSLVEKVDCSQYSKLESSIYQQHFKNNDPTVIFIGRLTPQKKLDWIIKAIKQLRDNGTKTNLAIVGDGPCKGELTQLAEELGVSKYCWFFGECYDESVNNKLLYNAELCVSPGNVGLTALHAMIYGVPVISHDDFETQMPEYEVILNGRTGMLFKHNDFGSFCETIEKWFDMKLNRSEIRENCYSMINGKWNSDYQINLLKEVIGK